MNRRRSTPKNRRKRLFGSKKAVADREKVSVPCDRRKTGLKCDSKMNGVVLLETTRIRHSEGGKTGDVEVFTWSWLLPKRKKQNKGGNLSGRK